MNFLVDRCAGRRLTQWLQSQGHNALDARELGPDPGDRALLERAVSENRILITMDKDFGELIHLHGRPHTGLIRLPEVRMAQRITLVVQRQLLLPVPSIILAGSPPVSDCAAGPLRCGSWGRRIPG